MIYRLAELEERWPSTPWREPVPVQTPTQSGLGCRVCIASGGLAAKSVAKLPQTREEWDEHFRSHLDG